MNADCITDVPTFTTLNIFEVLLHVLVGECLIEIVNLHLKHYDVTALPFLQVDKIAIVAEHSTCMRLSLNCTFCSGH